LLLEGRDLATLLAQVNSEHGPDAKIVSAERVRTGGFAGLFSHEKFELTVEVPDSPAFLPQAPKSPAPPISAAATVAQLAEMNDAADFTPAEPLAQQRIAPAQDARAAFADLLAGARSGGPATVAAAPATASEALAARLRGDPAPGTAPGTAGSNGGGTATDTAARAAPGNGGVEAAIAASISGMLSDDKAGDTATAEAPAEATPSVRPFRPNANQQVAKLGLRALPLPPLDPALPDETSTVDDPATVSAQTPDAPTPPAAAPPPTPAEAPVTAPPAAVRSEAALTEAAYTPDNATATAEPRSQSPSAAQPAPSNRQENAVPVDAPEATSTPVGMYTASARAGTASPPGTEERPGALPRRLQALGVPAELARQATGQDTYSAILHALVNLPVAAPAPDGGGETLLVIGETAHAVAVARTVADALRIEADDLLLAGRSTAGTGIDAKRRIAGAHDARVWAKKLRKSDVPSVIAVEAAADESDWALSIVDAIRPAAVWLVVDAGRKTADISRQLRSLRRVDAIAVRGTHPSGDPASILALGVPVALLEGRKPSAHAWAALLCERLIRAAG
jgi:hypothetical protein